METPRFGWEHYEKMEATPEEILSFVDRETKGVYVFQKIPDGYWEPLLAAKKKLDFALEWEINGDVATRRGAPGSDRSRSSVTCFP